ncbi:MAG TPA: hypothetical protein DCY55_08955 [Gammaproteobacteria bacterium]|jgi:hypothetical protein|nr:hypothetical protein [Gammaproteobacteria bacterium]
MMRLIPTAILFCVLFAGFRVNAHHAGAGLYDRNTVGEIKGDISTIFWRNPHVRLGIVVSSESGEAQEWQVEFGSVNTVERLGVSRDKLNVGDQVTISGDLGRNGRPVMFADALTLSTGEELVLQAPSAQRYGLTENALSDARAVDSELRADIFRVWLPGERPNTGAGTTEYPLTDVGLAAQLQWDAAEDPALRCIPPGVPTAMDNPYPIEFIDQGDTIVMRLEEWDGVRTINMNAAGSVEPVQPRMGYSTGRWEGDSLIVNTSNIGWRYVDDLGTPQSEDAVIMERFTLSSDGTELDWHAEIADPVNFTEPVVMTGTWIWIPGHEIKPFNCALPDEG